MATSTIKDTYKGDLSSSVTFDSTNFKNSSTAKVFKVGKVCYVQLGGTAKTNLTNTSLILSGLPTPVFENQIFNCSYLNKNFQIAVLRNGDLKFMYSPAVLAANEDIGISFMYLCE